MEYSSTRTKSIPAKAYLALDRKIAEEFHASAEKTIEYPHDYGEMRLLRMELQELCGITELEALNVLIYRNVSDYIWKYNRVKSAADSLIEHKLERTIGLIASDEA